MEVWVLRCGLVWRGEPLHHLAMVPLVLSGPLCPFGTSPHPVGSHPFQGRLLRVGKFWGWNGGLLGRWDPSTTFGGPPPLEGRQLGKLTIL